MEKNSDILDEIKEISPLLAGLQGINVFSVPENYFDKFSSSVLLQLDKQEISSPAQDTPFQVPEGYFENLSSNILQRIKSESSSESEDNLPAFLNGREINLPFTVPGNYFENLPHQIIDRVARENNSAKAKVVPFYFRRVFRYAAAAVVAALVIIASYFTFNNFSGKKERGFAVVTKKTVQDRDALKYNSEKAFDEGIASLSDDQIIGYLENHGTAFDLDALVKSTDTTTLPDPAEYLINDNTLSDILQKINDKSIEKQ